MAALWLWAKAGLDAAHEWRLVLVLVRAEADYVLNLANVNARLERFEGRTNYMYLDTVGVVTVGVGHALFTPASAVALPWDDPSTVVAGFIAVLTAKRPMPAAFYKHFTVPRLPEAAIDAMRDKDVQKKLGEITRALPGWAAWPDAVREGIVDIGFNCGVGGLLKFPRMLAACRAGDWDTAANESHRPQVSVARNDDVAALFMRAAAPVLKA